MIGKRNLIWILAFLFSGSVLLTGLRLTSEVSAVSSANLGRIAFGSNRDGNHEIYVMDAVDANNDGNGDNQRRLTNNPAQDSGPVWSPDGKRIAFYSDRYGNFDVFIMDAVDSDNDGNGDNLIRLTTNSASDSQPTWSPDGSKIAFASNRDGGNEIYVMNTDGTNQIRLTTIPQNDAPAWSPDGTKIAFLSNRDNDNNEIYIMNMDGTNQTRITNVPGQDRYPDWSPDSGKIAFTSTRTGSSELALEIYTMNADGSSQTRLTNNTARDFLPDWSPDGRKIAFYSEIDSDFEIYVMDAVDADSDGNGDNLYRLTDNTFGDFDPDWYPSVLVEIDIKPGSSPNCFNNNEKGVIPVAILGSSDFDITKIDNSTIRLESLPIKVVGKSNKYLSHVEDINNDGFNDLVVQIEDVDGIFFQGTGAASLTGRLMLEFGSTLFKGTDAICIAQ